MKPIAETVEAVIGQLQPVKDDKPIPIQQAVMVRPEQPMTPGLFGTTEPTEIITKAASVATALKEVVVKQGLVSNINGKQYPRCEAWTLLGTMLGVFPVLVWTRKIEKGWEARVEAKTKDGAVVGAAEAECLSTEKNWSNRDDFAIRSMAQTRATAKCLRMPLGFVMTLSGFEATPAEEMIGDGPKPTPKPPAMIDPKLAKEVVGLTKKEATDKTRAWFIAQVEENRLYATQFCVELGWIMPNEKLEDVPLRFVPTSGKQMESFKSCMGSWVADGKIGNPYLPNKYGNEAPVGQNVPQEQEEDDEDADAKSEVWYDYIVPIPHKGQKRADYVGNEDTIGSLYAARHDDDEARKRLWGFCQHYEPKGWEKKDGTKMPPSKTDIEFRAMLDAFHDWFEKNHPEDKL